MEGWLILLTILIIAFMVLPNITKKSSEETYMRAPLEQFILKAGDAACCKFGFSPHQYVLTGPPGNTFRHWYATQ